MYLLKTIKSMKLKIKKYKREIVAITLIIAYPTLYILFIGISEASRIHYLIIGFFTTSVAALYIVNPGFTKYVTKHVTKHAISSFFKLYFDHAFSVFKVYIVILPMLYGFTYTFIAPFFHYSIEHVKCLLRLCSIVSAVLSYFIATRSLRESQEFIETLKKSLGVSNSIVSISLHVLTFSYTMALISWTGVVDTLVFDVQEILEMLALSGTLMSFFLLFTVLLVLGYESRRIIRG